MGLFYFQLKPFCYGLNDRNKPNSGSVAVKENQKNKLVTRKWNFGDWNCNRKAGEGKVEQFHELNDHFGRKKKKKPQCCKTKVGRFQEQR